jgi:hypothetical protein
LGPAPTDRANTTKDWELLFEPDLAKKRLVRLGFFFQPWQTVEYVDDAAIGRFEGDEFDPLT